MFTTFYIAKKIHIQEQFYIIFVLSTFCYIVSVVLVKNKPNTLMEKYKSTSPEQIK